MNDRDYLKEVKIKAFESTIPPIYRNAEITDFSEGLQKKIVQLIEGHNAIILGDNGVGKTRIAWTVMKELNRQEKKVRYVKAQILLFDVKRNDDPYGYCEKEFGKCSTLIVDEIDKIFESKADFIYLNYLVDFMSEWEKQVIFIGNGTREHLIETLGQSIYSRLRGNGGLEIQVTGKDRRLG